MRHERERVHGRWLRLQRKTQMNTTPKVALVTGASSGFGQATAALLTAQGFLVFGTSRAPAHNAAGGFELLPLDVRQDLNRAEPSRERGFVCQQDARKSRKDPQSHETNDADHH